MPKRYYRDRTPSERIPHLFEKSGTWETLGEVCAQCGEVESGMWHWVEVDGMLEPPK